MVDISKLKKNDILSESSHYKVIDRYNNNTDLLHYESNEIITIEDNYIEKLLDSGDDFNNIVEVTKEDKKDGTLGIRSIFENIHSGQVFTVTYKKQDRPKSKKTVEAEKETQRNEAIGLIDKAKKAKKSMATAYKEALEFIQNNPIKDYIEGEERVLRGYKLQFVSRDGKYRCMDMDITRTDKESGERLVNINTISQLIYNGTKYVVK